MQKQLTQKFAKFSCPGQEKNIIDVLQPTSSLSDSQINISEEILRFVDMYHQSDALGKLVILSMVDHQKFSKSALCKIFGFSKYMVDKRRKLKSFGKGLVIPVRNIHRHLKLDINKCEKFLDLFYNNLLQDVVYGVTDIKFDNGDKQRVVHAILTTKYSHAIAFYIETCKNTQFQPLSESSLVRILKGINPVQQKSLSGLDDITTQV